MMGQNGFQKFIAHGVNMSEETANELRKEVRNFFKHIRETTVYQESIFKQFTRIKNENPKWFQKMFGSQ
jgi:hypothetical protein